MERRIFLRVIGGVAALAHKVRPLALQSTEADPGWRVRFIKVYDLLMMRSGGPNGPLIHFSNRGKADKYTWTWQDPVEVRDISEWVNDAPTITLYAEISRDTNGGTGEQRCQLEVLYNGTSAATWDFVDRGSKEVRRPAQR